MGCVINFTVKLITEIKTGAALLHCSINEYVDLLCLIADIIVFTIIHKVRQRSCSQRHGAISMFIILRMIQCLCKFTNFLL